MKFLLVSLFALFLGLQAKAKSAVYDVTSLFNDPSGSIELMGGKELKLSRALARGAKVLFEDTKPGANWGHPGIFKVVSAAGEVLETSVTRRPPRHLNEDLLPILAPDIFFANPAVEFKIDTFQGKYLVKNAEKHYALLINGQANKRHWNDYSFLYRVLTQMYGYQKENIFVLDGSYLASSPDLDGDSVADIKYGSNLADLQAVMKLLTEKLTAEDHLLIAVNDHGDQVDGESTIVLYDQDIKASDYAKLFNQLKAGSVISIHEQCFSGGFVRPSVGTQRIAMAAATNDEYSWASMDLNFDEFIYHAIVALARQTHDGKAIVSDLNNDGFVSAQEAFAYAVANDKRPESPILEADKNAGTSALLGISRTVMPTLF